MKKGIYLVTELGCMQKGSGAYHHIEIGVKYLSKYFDVTLISPSIDNPKIGLGNNQKENIIKRILKKTGVWGTIKDLVILYHNHRSIYSFYKTVKSHRVDFIYERVAYLDFKGLITAKCLKIPHFYENNGVKYFERKKIYFSWFYPLAFELERVAYKRSTFVFFVGLWGNMIASKKKNWMNIENGIEENFIAQFKTHHKKVEDKINLCFIGSLMKHHNMPLLITALSQTPNRDQFHLHLFGDKLESAFEEIQTILPATYHGFLTHNELSEVLKEMHVGLIPGAEEYPSHMKLFDYGAAKCIVLAPDVQNIKYWFKENELILFKQNSVEDLKNRLSLLDKDFIENSQYGINLYNKIERQFTWSQLFSQISSVILNQIP
jgi:glycosyltransferase involved in cell wall biosynthesis